MVQIGAGAGMPGVVMPLAVTYSIDIGKGLREPCPPYSQAIAFGAGLNAFDAGNWNCVPEVVEPTRSFNLSAIAPDHSIAVWLNVLYNLPAGKTYQHICNLYRARDLHWLFNGVTTIPDPGSLGYSSWSWFYIASCFDYMSSQIYEDGDYFMEMLLDGQLLGRIGFVVSGTHQPRVSQFTLEGYGKVL